MLPSSEGHRQNLRINFVLPPSTSITGGPLAILEYANRLSERGHDVSITTYPDTAWPGDDPFPWFKVKGRVLYKHLRDRNPPTLMADIRRTLEDMTDNTIERDSFLLMGDEFTKWLDVVDVIPDCDINIATFWSTVFPVYYSRKGKPVFFMQHFEEVFYEASSTSGMLVLARAANSLPTYKIANSSWLQKVVKERFFEDVPFSNNAIDQGDFAPQAKPSDEDGILRVVTYSRPEIWKGFADAVGAMRKVRERFPGRVEWHVFGYQHGDLGPTNAWAPYTYHPKLSFAALTHLYGTSDVALCPSWYESFPLPPLEAMASGTVPVTTAAGTEDYAFHERNALVVPSRDTEAMAQAVLRLLRDAPLRRTLAAEGLATAAAYTWERAVKEREELLLKIHRDQLGADRWRSLALGLEDGSGRPFEMAPADAAPPREGYVWDAGGHLLLIFDGRRRHIRSPELIPVLLERGWTEITIGALDLARIPFDQPIVSPAGVPFPKTGKTARKSGDQAEEATASA